MTEELCRAKYRYLLNRLQSIGNKTIKLQNNSKELDSYVEKSFRIDDESYAKDDFDNLKSKYKKILEEHKELIARVSKKI